MRIVTQNYHMNFQRVNFVRIYIAFYDIDYDIEFKLK